LYFRKKREAVQGKNNWNFLLASAARYIMSTEQMHFAKCICPKSNFCSLGLQNRTVLQLQMH
ncbi:MAG: hypothetical protein RSA62_04380, partial [Oscillospiraceae bacterium]